MRKLSLAAIGMYVSILSAFSQPVDSSSYKNRKLQLDEINFVSGYYKQNGNHSAVTGGIGTEELTDFANTIELKLSRYDARLRKHSFSFELGVDHYSSASSDKIDPTTISSASSADTRIYPTIGWSVQNEEKKTTFGITTSFSYEYDYLSFGLGTQFTKASKDNNREINGKLQLYLDKWSVIYPIELRQNGGENISPLRNTYNGSLALSQVVNKNLQVLLIAEPTYQTGLLATKYQRVYFKDATLRSENLPEHRLKIPLGIRANYFLGDKIILRSFYRYYQDDWGLQAHTIDMEVPVKLTPFFSVSPFYRFYSQNGIDYFSPYSEHIPGESFFTSDYDLSKFTSRFYGAGVRVAPPNGVLHIHKLNSLEMRYGHYNRNDGLHSDQVSIHLKWKNA